MWDRILFILNILLGKIKLPYRSLIKIVLTTTVMFLSSYFKVSDYDWLTAFFTRITHDTNCYRCFRFIKLHKSSFSKEL